MKSFCEGFCIGLMTAGSYGVSKEQFGDKTTLFWIVFLLLILLGFIAIKVVGSKQ